MLLAPISALREALGFEDMTDINASIPRRWTVIRRPYAGNIGYDEASPLTVGRSNSMSNTSNALMVEILRNVQGTLARLEVGQTEIRAQLVSMSHILAGSVAADVARQGEIAALKVRLDRVETRLDLNGDPAV